MNGDQLEQRKTPLALAAALLSELCERIDAGESPEGALLESFNDSRLALADAVDRRIAFDTWVKGAIDAAKEARDDWAAQAKRLEGLHDAFKKNTLQVVEGTPDVPYQGRLGKIAVQNNPPALETVFQEKQLSGDMIDMFGIDPEFYTVETVYKLNTKAVKAALAEGKSIPWALLTQGRSVRFRK